MNQTILGRLINLMFVRMYATEGEGGGTGAATPPVVKPEDARAFLVEFGHSADTLKTAKDEDVLKTYGTVNASFTKRAEAASKAAAEKSTKEATEAVAGNKTKWEKGEHKLELPTEKTMLTQADADEIAATAREQGLSPDQAKAALQSRDVAYQTAIKRQIAMSDAQHAEWVKTLQADPELPTLQKNSQRAIDKFMSPEFRTALKNTRFGDHPLMVKFLSAVGAAMGEDGGMGGGSGGGGKKSAEDVLYGAPSK